MIFDFKESNPVYSAPILGNGSITLCIGPDGSMNSSGSETIVKDLPGRSIWWAARRYVGELTHPLIPFGRFTDSVNGTPLYASQELDAFRAEVTCDTQYDIGSIKTKVFVHTEYNMVVIKKILDPKQLMNFVFTYSFCDRNDDNRAVSFSECEVKKTKSGGEICYHMLDDDIPSTG